MTVSNDFVTWRCELMEKKIQNTCRNVQRNGFVEIGVETYIKGHFIVPEI